MSSRWAMPRAYCVRAVGLRAREIGILFAIGAAGGLVGDAGNVDAGQTRYLDHSWPFIWNSPVWFVALVGIATVSVGVVRVHLGPTRPGFDPHLLAGCIAAVIGIYAATSVAGDDGTASVALITALGVLTACVVGDRYGVVCGLAAAIAGPIAEIVIVNLDVSEYTAANDALFGVALWLPGLYLAFGVAVARITELLVAARS
jgi:hypothetical protein